MADADDDQESNPMLEKAKLSHIEYLRKTERRKNSAQVATKVAMRRDERLERERLKKQKEEQLALIKANEVQYDAEGNPIKVKKSDKRAISLKAKMKVARALRRMYNAMPRLLHHFWGHPVRGTFQRPIAFSIGEHV